VIGFLGAVVGTAPLGIYSAGKVTRSVVTKIYDRRVDILAKLSVPISVSEAHGMATGLLCGQAPSLAKGRWLTELLDAGGVAADAVQHRAVEIRELDSWFDETVAALNDADLAFEPAVPDDESILLDRTTSMVDFCSGFNYGFGLSAVGRKTTALPDDTKEVITDFQAIENLDLDSIDPADDDAWHELIEYIRVGVLLVHEELQPVSSGDNKQLH